MNTTQAQQKALDDTLVAPADRLEFEKCNMRLKTDIKPKEATFQVMLDALAYILPCIPDHCRCSRQVFEDLPLEQDILSFIRDLEHTRDITYLTDVNVDYLHQPWRAFATAINKCLSDKKILREKAPKPKYFQKKADSDTSPKKKHVQATKGTRLKSKANVAKPNKKKQPAKKEKAKGLAILSEVALIEAEQIKLATNRSKKDFHISHASGLDEGTGTKPGVPNVPPYESASDKESWGDSEDDGDC
uniref:Uncharacterized protein n=1 Tax=Tanacetum cinerariifolium TaxID=118510 RepID=A0A699GTD9_TANCI|nr:hypothetical protein [Tanacetum cinerariifolium]